MNKSKTLVDIIKVNSKPGVKGHTVHSRAPDYTADVPPPYTEFTSEERPKTAFSMSGVQFVMDQ